MGALPANQWAPVFSVRRRGGGAVDVIRLPIGANQTILRGHLLAYGTSGSAGKVVQAIATALTAGQGIQSGGSLGSLFVALEDKSSGASPAEEETIAVMPLRGPNEVQLQAANFPSSAGAFGAATGTTKAGVLVGTSYRLGLFNNGGALQYGLSINSTGGDATVVEKSSESEPADTYTRVWVTKSF